MSSHARIGEFKGSKRIGARILKRTQAFGRVVDKVVARQFRSPSKKHSVLVHAHYIQRKGKPVFVKAFRRKRAKK
jgi:hypothetical protein